MPRPVLLVALAAVALAGCNKGPTVVVVPAAPAANETTSATPVAAAPAPPIAPIPIPTPELSPHERYDAAVLSAIALLTDHKYAEALAAFEQAQKVQDGETIRLEIAGVKARLAAAKAAEKTVQDIQNVLIDGKPDEAGRLAVAALREYGDTDSAAALAKLKLQADALSTVALEQSARAARFRREAEEAERANNLRGAAVAYEEAVAAGDRVAAARLAMVRENLGRYDDGRRKAAELRRDPARLEDALSALKSAAGGWDTPQVRREIDECSLALQCRRDRIGVAEFEMRGPFEDIFLCRSVADGVLAAFRPRYDTADREEIVRACDRLRVQPRDLFDSATARAEFARLANLRYLVVGAISPFNGATAHARLLDLRTGLVVQTARVSAPSADGLALLSAQLAAMLQMSDDQRLVYERQLAQQAAAVAVATEPATLPPPPAIAGESLPPLIIGTARPPELGGIVPEDFAKLPRPGQAAVEVKFALTGNHKVRGRVLAVSVELGDDLFRRGRIIEARNQFELALAVAPGRPEIVARLEKCRSAPPPVVAVASPPRAAVLDFVTVGLPTESPSSGLGAWAADNVAPYLSPPYELADRGNVYWYMGRLGITVRDAVVDPVARFYLGRALNLRFIVLGTLRQTPAGLEVVAHLLDTETGAELSTVSVVARDRGELKCRLGDVARWLLLDPAERMRREAEASQAQSLLAQAEVAAKASNFTLAIELTKQAGQKTPGVRVEVLLNQFDRSARAAAAEAQRRGEWERQQAVAAEAARRQQELAAAAEAARVAAAQQVASAAAAEKQQRRDAACQQLIAQARAARDAQNFTLAVQLYESALAINRRAGVVNELAAVKTRAEEQARARDRADAVIRDAALMQERVAEMARVQARIETERKQKATAEAARRKLQEESDARSRAAAAEAARQTEERLKADAATEAKRQADLKANAEAQAKARAEEKQLADAAQAKRLADAAEAKRRADAEAKRLSDAAEAKRRADEQSKADLAARLKAEAEANARTAESKRQADAKAKADLEARQRAEAEERARAVARPPVAVPVTRPTPPPVSSSTPPPGMTGASPQAFKEQMEAGVAYEKQDRYGDARRSYLAALQIMPAHADALWRADYALHMDNGLTALKAGRKPDAVREFESALRSAPKDPAALRWLQLAK
jgi:tetratricopeptide (TPR) repeat protein